MRPLKKIKRKAKLKPRLKASPASASAFGRTAASLAAIAAACAAGIWIAVPFLIYAISALKGGPVSFVSSVDNYVEESLLTGWGAIGSIPSYQTPAAIFTLMIVLGATYLAICAVHDSMTPSNLKNIFGPAASRGNEKGSARLFVNEYMLSLLTETWDGDWENPPKCAAPIIGYSPTFGYYLAPGESHTVAFGVTGSGKTTSLNYCSLDALVAAGASVVISDPKGELYNATGPTLREKGINVRLIDFRNPDRSECINPVDTVTRAFEEHRLIREKKSLEAIELATRAGVPLEKARDMTAWGNVEMYEKFRSALLVAENERVNAWAKAEEAARDLAGAIIPDRPDAGAAAHWEQVARMLLQSLILFVATYVEEDYIGKDGKAYATPLPEQRTLESVHHMLSKFGGVDEKGKKLESILDRIDERHPAHKAFAQARNSETREYNTAVAETTKFLSEVLSMSLNRILNRSDLSLAELGEKQTVLFIVIPDERPMVGKLFTTIVAQAYQELIACAIRSGGKMKVPVHFILEEVGNLAVPIPELPQKLAMGRGYGIYFHLTLQDMEQLPARYGRYGQSTILSNCGVRMLIKTNDAQVTGKYFSDNMGSYTYVSNKMTRKRGALGLTDSSSSSSSSEGGRPVMYPAELTSWNPDWGTIVLMNKPGRKPGIAVKLLFGYQTMMPCVFPRESAWNTETGENLGITEDREAMAEKAGMAQGESRLEERTPNTVWEPRYLAPREKAALAERVKKDGVSAEAAEDLGRFAAAREAKEYAKAFVKRYVGAEEAASGGAELLDKAAIGMRRAYGAELGAKLKAEQPGISEEALSRAISVRLAAAEGVVVEIVSKALAEGDFSSLAKFPEPMPQPEKGGAGEEAEGEGKPEVKQAAAPKKKTRRKDPSVQSDKSWIDDIRAVLKQAVSEATTIEDFIAAAELSGVKVIDSKGCYSYRLEGRNSSIAASKVGNKFTKAELMKKFETAAEPKAGNAGGGKEEEDARTDN